MLQQRHCFLFLSEEIHYEGQEAQNVEETHYWKMVR